MENLPSIQGLPDARFQAEQLTLELAKSAAQSQNLLAQKLEASQASRTQLSRQQLESMIMNAERSLSNEVSTRVLTSMFGKFSLLQKIMQTMG